MRIRLGMDIFSLIMHFLAAGLGPFGNVKEFLCRCLTGRIGQILTNVVCCPIFVSGSTWLELPLSASSNMSLRCNTLRSHVLRVRIIQHP
jgi:hypothetical protein